jgi:hypothetical protein
MTTAARRVAVVTSSPPLTEGGHLVIARALVEALRECGHHAGLVVTPQNRFGRQASAYLATWLTDLGDSPHGPIDQVISLRYPSYAIRHPAHVCWLNHTMREYYDRWESFSAGLSPLAKVKEGPVAAPSTRPMATCSGTASRGSSRSRTPSGSASPGICTCRRPSCTRRLRRARIGAMHTATTSSPSRG